MRSGGPSQRRRDFEPGELEPGEIGPHHGKPPTEDPRSRQSAPFSNERPARCGPMPREPPREPMRAGHASQPGYPPGNGIREPAPLQRIGAPSADAHWDRAGKSRATARGGPSLTALRLILHSSSRRPFTLGACACLQACAGSGADRGPMPTRSRAVRRCHARDRSAAGRAETRGAPPAGPHPWAAAIRAVRATRTARARRSPATAPAGRRGGARALRREA